MMTTTMMMMILSSGSGVGVQTSGWSPRQKVEREAEKQIGKRQRWWPTRHPTLFHHHHPSFYKDVDDEIEEVNLNRETPF